MKWYWWLIIVIVILIIAFSIYKNKTKVLSKETGGQNDVVQKQNYKFIKEITVDGTYNDGHVPTPKRTFKIGDVINGIYRQATTYPVASRANVYFIYGNGEVYQVSADNLVKY